LIHFYKRINMLDQEEKNKNGVKLQKRVILSNISACIWEILSGVCMVFIGAGIYIFEKSEQKLQFLDPCPNGAARWLFTAGIILILVYGSNALSKVYLYQDVMISTPVGFCSSCISGFCSTLAVIAKIAVIIWGSVIVFGAWSKWTYDPNKYLTDGNLNYCEYYPMMFAFVILIIEWVLIPVVFILTCLSVCWMGVVKTTKLHDKIDNAIPI